MLVYLAGSMTEYDKRGELEKATEWRDKATKYLNDINIKVFNPMINYEQNKGYVTRGVVFQNKHYLDKADLILLNLEYLEYSPGSLYEIFTFLNSGKPVVTFGSTPIYYQPHINESITLLFTELKFALDYIASMYCQV